MLEILRAVARLELAPTRRPRRAAAVIEGAGAWPPSPAAAVAAVAVVALAAVCNPVSGVRSAAVAVSVVDRATATIIVAPPTVHSVVAVAIAATAWPFGHVAISVHLSTQGATGEEGEKGGRSRVRDAGRCHAFLPCKTVEPNRLFAIW